MACLGVPLRSAHEVGSSTDEAIVSVRLYPKYSYALLLQVLEQSTIVIAAVVTTDIGRTVVPGLCRWFVSLVALQTSSLIHADSVALWLLSSCYPCTL